MVRTKLKEKEKVEITTKENKMGTMPVGRLLFSMSVPIIISMVVQALYNIVDSIYVAQFDPVAGTGALTVAFPIQSLMIAVSVGLAVGMNALISRSLGEKDFNKANVMAGQGFFLMMMGYLLFLVIGLFLVGPYVSTQAAEGSLLYTYSRDYLSVVCVFGFGVFVQVVTERMLQATGRAFYSMIIQLSGAVVNIILDPVFIFGWFGVPEMGIKGAAIATVIGQCSAAVIGLVINIFKNKEIRLEIKNFIPRKKPIFEMLAIGIPSVLMQAIGSVMTFTMNMILISFSNVALNVFGVYFKLQSFVFMPVFGLNSGLVPIVSYNFGARRRDRVFSSMRLAIFAAVGYMLLGFLAFQLLPETLLGIFNASSEMLEIGSVALRIISISFIFAGFSMVCSSTCQALGKSIYSLIISVARQLGVLLPAAYLLSLSRNISLVWLAFPIAEAVCLALCVFFLFRVMRRVFPKEDADGNDSASVVEE